MYSLFFIKIFLPKNGCGLPMYNYINYLSSIVKTVNTKATNKTSFIVSQEIVFDSTCRRRAVKPIT